MCFATERESMLTMDMTSPEYLNYSSKPINEVIYSPLYDGATETRKISIKLNSSIADENYFNFKRFSVVFW